MTSGANNSANEASSEASSSFSLRTVAIRAPHPCAARVVGPGDGCSAARLVIRVFPVDDGLTQELRAVSLEQVGAMRFDVLRNARLIAGSVRQRLKCFDVPAEHQVKFFEGAVVGAKLRLEFARIGDRGL